MIVPFVRFLKSIYCRIYRRRSRCGKMRYGQIEEVVSEASGRAGERASDATSESMNERANELECWFLRAESSSLSEVARVRKGTVVLYLTSKSEAFKIEAMGEIKSNE